jgi:hypothetical protein
VANEEEMAQAVDRLKAFVEVGKKKVFAGALDWPGLYGYAKDEAGALEALVEAGPRFQQALKGARLGFKAPKGAAALKVVERLKGTATTDFGAPDVAPKSDARPVEAAELRRLAAILKASWRAFDAAAEAAAGRELAKGPRGGGRDLERILEHLLGSDQGYLSQLGWKLKLEKGIGQQAARAQTREAVLEGLAAAAKGEIAKRGPRGGLRWNPRYFVRRSAWHWLDHAWEIEKRLVD